MEKLDKFQEEQIRLAKEQNISLEEYADQFDWTQLEQIRLGLEKKRNVAIYAKECYISYQMKEIRLGLEEGLDVFWYENPIYDWLQMGEIRRGLEEKLNVSVYAKPEYDYHCMHQMRKGLLAGINLVEYWERGYQTPILRQIRKAYVDHVDILPYVAEGYDDEQLEEIRYAQKKVINIFPYIDKATAGSQMREIRLGLEHGVDVNRYKASEFNWAQMREIRLGLEKNLEVYWYADTYYSHMQMREIRLGLESGISVAEYASYMNSASDMRKKREWITQNGTLEQLESFMEELEEVSVPTICVYISEDQMSAEIELPFVKEEYSVDQILATLKEEGIKLGIQKEKIEEVLEQKLYGQRVRVAEGKESIDGEDGHYQFFFRTEMPHIPKLLPDGSVDYQNVEFFEEVKKEQKLAVYTPATVGTYGYKVTGTMLAPKRGKEMQKLRGEGFHYEEETETYISDTDGRIELIGNEMRISTLYTYKGDVTSSSGNLRFSGDIHVTGYVGSGVTIEAEGDIVVDGNVESAVLKAGKNILLKSGVCAPDGGVLEAGESISGKYFESVTLIAGGEIKANYLLNCDATTKEKIIVSGKKGAIVGGVSHAMYGISSYNIGNAAERKTVLDIGMNETFYEEWRKLDEEAHRVKEETIILKNSMLKLEETREPQELNGLTIYEKMRQAMHTKQEEFNQIRERQANMMQKMQKHSSIIQVRVMENAYAGCVIKIDRASLLVRETAKQVLFKKQGDEVAAFSGRSV